MKKKKKKKKKKGVFVLGSLTRAVNIGHYLRILL